MLTLADHTQSVLQLGLEGRLRMRTLVPGFVLNTECARQLSKATILQVAHEATNANAITIMLHCNGLKLTLEPK